MKTYGEWLLSWKHDTAANPKYINTLLSQSWIDEEFDTPRHLIKLADGEYDIVCLINATALDYIDYLHK